MSLAEIHYGLPISHSLKVELLEFRKTEYVRIVIDKKGNKNGRYGFRNPQITPKKWTRK